MFVEAISRCKLKTEAVKVGAFLLEKQPKSDGARDARGAALHLHEGNTLAWFVKPSGRVLFRAE